MLLIAGTVRVAPEQMPATRAALAPVLAATRAEEGCLSYAFAEDVLDPGLLHVSERWRDQAALDAHVASPHVAVWRAAAAGLGVRERALMVYEVGEGQPV
jgi:quinol monooxygenase YgiN